VTKTQDAVREHQINPLTMLPGEAPRGRKWPVVWRRRYPLAVLS
jgi:hypothetical protein